MFCGVTCDVCSVHGGGALKTELSGVGGAIPILFYYTLKIIEPYGSSAVKECKEVEVACNMNSLM